MGSQWKFTLYTEYMCRKLSCIKIETVVLTFILLIMLRHDGLSVHNKSKLFCFVYCTWDFSVHTKHTVRNSDKQWGETNFSTDWVQYLTKCRDWQYFWWFKQRWGAQHYTIMRLRFRLRAKHWWVRFLTWFLVNNPATVPILREAIRAVHVRMSSTHSTVT
jgi:hypothetical protein